MDDLKREKENYQITKKIKMRNMKILESEIEKMKSQKDKLGELINKNKPLLQAIQNQINSVNTKMFKSEEEVDNNISQQNSLIEIGNKMQSSHQILKFENEKSIRITKLERFDRNSYAALDWINKNQNRLEKPVHGPICVDISVKDSRYADALENCMNISTLKTFVCCCEADYNTLDRYLITENHLKVNLVMFDHKRLSDFKPSASNVEIKKMGFDGYLIDFIEAPDPVLVALCINSGIHTTPVSLKKNINAGQDELGRIFSSYILGDTFYSVKRSQYGKMLSSTRTSNIRRAQHINTNISETAEKKQKLEDEITNLRNKQDENEINFKKFKSEEAKFRAKFDKCKEEKYNLIEKRNTFLEPTKQVQNIELNIESKKTDLNSLIEQIETLANPDKLNDDIALVAEKQATNLISFRDSIIERTRLEKDTSELYCKSIEFRIFIDQISPLFIDLNDAKSHWSAQLKKVEDQMSEAKQKPMALLNQVKHMMEGLTEEEKESLETYNDPDQVGKEIAELNADLNVRFSASKATMDIYNKRMEEIGEVGGKVDKFSGLLKNVGEKINKIQKTFLPTLDDLIKGICEKFNNILISMNYCGEVQLFKPSIDIDGVKTNEYEKWGVQILVKFRNTEKLQLLTSHRQSGGEKSVSTISYLLSLQNYNEEELGIVPFKLVDEINQGMDSKNERLIHEALLSLFKSCNSQFFIISPKLLNNLEYDDSIVVHCIFNGIADNNVAFDLHSYLQKKITT